MKQVYLFFLISIIIFGCKPNKITDSNGRLRIVNASSSSGDINMFVDFEKIYQTDVQYLNYSLYREYISNKHRIQIKNASGNLLIDTNLFIENNKSYSIIIFDSLSNLKYKVVEDVFTPPVGSFCKVRFLNLSKDNDIVDFQKMGNNSLNLTAFKNGDNSEFISMESGYTQFDVFYTGTSNLMYNYYGYQYKPGAFYTVFLKGTKSSLGFDSLGIYTIENHLNY